MIMVLGVIYKLLRWLLFIRGRRGGDRMVFRFTTTYAIIADYH